MVHLELQKELVFYIICKKKKVRPPREKKAWICTSVPSQTGRGWMQQRRVRGTEISQPTYFPLYSACVAGRSREQESHPSTQVYSNPVPVSGPQGRIPVARCMEGLGSPHHVEQSRHHTSTLLLKGREAPARAYAPLPVAAGCPITCWV